MKKIYIIQPLYGYMEMVGTKTKIKIIGEYPDYRSDGKKEFNLLNFDVYMMLF